MWNMAVVAFYYQLRISHRAANTVQRAMYQKLCTAMASHAAFAKQLIAFAAAPEERRQQALKEAADTINSIISTLQIDLRDFITDNG